MSIHSPFAPFAQAIAATISKMPVISAQMAMKYTSTSAVVTSYRRVNTPFFESNTN